MKITWIICPDCGVGPGADHKKDCPRRLRNRFRQHATNALHAYRFDCIPPRPDGAALAIFHEGLADLIRLRLRVAYMPLFQGLARIEARVGIMADLREDYYAPRPKR